MKKRSIISDSALDLSEELKGLSDVSFIPFKIDFPDRKFIDTQDGDTKELMDFMHETESIATTSCPSPGEFLEAIEEKKDSDEIFILTLSKGLSGSFNSAKTAVDMFLAENPDKKVYVFDTISASSGITILYLKLVELINSELEFEDIIKEMEKTIKKTQALCSTEDFSQFIKSGRMNKIAANFAHTINIMPVITLDEEGNIIVEKITRGNKSLVKGISEIIKNHTDSTSDKILVISHNHAPDKAELIMERIKKDHDFKEIYTVPMHMIVSTYVHYRGVIIGFEKDK